MWHHEEERYEKPYLDLYFDRKAERKLESSEKARFTSKQEMFQGGFKLNSALLETSFFPYSNSNLQAGKFNYVPKTAVPLRATWGQVQK